MGFLGFTLAIIGMAGAVIVALIVTLLLTILNLIFGIVMVLRKRKPEAVCNFIAFCISLVIFLFLGVNTVKLLTPENTIIHSSQGDIEVEWDEECDIITAIEEDDVKKLEKLIKGKEYWLEYESIDGSLLAQAVEHDSIKSAEYLLDSGANVDFVGDSPDGADSFESMLNWYCVMHIDSDEKLNCEVVGLLLDHNAKVDDIRCMERMIELVYADDKMNQKEQEMFRHFLQKGAGLKEKYYDDLIDSYEEEMEWLDIKKENPEEYKNGLELIQEEWGEAE